MARTVSPKVQLARLVAKLTEIKEASPDFATAVDGSIEKANSSYKGLVLDDVSETYADCMEAGISQDEILNALDDNWTKAKSILVERRKAEEAEAAAKAKAKADALAAAPATPAPAHSG